MQHCQRLDQRLHLLSEEIRHMSQEKEQGQQMWRERLQRCQKQLKAKEEEMRRQSQYFENFKTQLHHKLSSYRDREQDLLKRIYSLEKQLLDITVSAATGMASMKGIRITAGPEKQSEDQDRLPTMREEGEGEEQKKEDTRTNCLPSMLPGRAKSPEGDKERIQTEVKESENKEARVSLNDSRLQGFIFSLQEDLRVLLEREEAGMTERRRLMEQLQEAQEKNQLLACKMEGMKAETDQLRLSETSLMEEVEVLREENQRLQQEATNQTHLQSSSDSESTRLSAKRPHSSHDVCWESSKQTSTKKSGENQPATKDDGVQPHLLAVPPIDHQAAAVYKQNDKKDFFSPTKWSTLPKHKAPVLFQPFFNKPKCHLHSLPFTAETFGNCKLGDVEESLSEESDALRRAFQSLGFDQDLQQQCEHLNVDQQHRKEQIKAVTLENAEPESQLRKTRCEEQTTSDLQSSREKIPSVSSCKRIDTPQSSQDDFSFDLNQEDLIQALNQENRALANRIQELLAHIEVKKDEIKKEQTQLKEQISELKENCVRLEQEKQEQSNLIFELTRKTEDDLNTILEFQQKLTEGGEVKEESQSNELWCQNDPSLSMSPHFLQNRREDDAESLVTKMLNETQIIQDINNLTKAQLEKQCSIQNNSNGVHVGLLTAQVTQLTNLVQNLKREEEELSGNLNCLREQQKEVSLSVQTQTEEKQQLTRTIWTLKEEKDVLFEALSNLRQEKEKLTKSVCLLREERDQVQRSTNALNQKKEQLTKLLSDLERHKEALTELISSKKKEEDIMIQMLQDLQKERDQISQAVLYLKQQKDKLGLLIPTPEKEQKETKDALIGCFKQEKQTLQINLESREEINKVHHRFSETEENQKKPLSSACAGGVKMAAAGTEVDAVPTCETRETLIQEKHDLIQEITATGATLKNFQKELDHSHSEIKRLCSELCLSEARRSEAERREAEQMMRLTHAASKMEDTKKDNEKLTAQVKELQVKLSVLLREKTEALFLKTQLEEQHRVLAAQLKAKTVALEELNSEYIELKQGQSSRDELSSALVSLRATYQDIRAKYDQLLKSKGLTDLDVVPLKAKLSSLVLKCQERNGLLLQMLRAMQRRGCMDPTLAQQVEHLLSDVALQDYSEAFTTRNHTQKQDGCSRFTQEFMSNFKDHSLQKVSPHQTCPAGSFYVWSKENKDRCAEKEQQSLICVNENSTNLQTCRDSAADVAETQTTHFPNQSPPVKERASVQGSPILTLDTNSSKVSAATELIHVGSRPEKLEFNHLDMKEQFTPDPGRRKKSSQNPSSPTSSIGSSSRLSSPEKILNMHEELQRTLISPFQLSEFRGRQQHPSRSPSPSNPRDQNSSSSLSLTLPLSPFKTFSKSAETNLSATLFTAVSARSANLSPSSSTNHHLKAVCAASSSYNSPPALAERKHESVPRLCKGPNQTKKMSTPPNTNADSPPTNTPAPCTTNASGFNIYSMTTEIYDAPATAAAETSHMKSPYSSPENSIKSARRFPDALKESSRSKPEAPAEVRSVEVIKTVGQSSLLIGWERPALDELGCSNGTFVYGYRIFLNGDFHKSIMSSACTKCILENIDLSAPVHIKVQTLGSNGLRSDSVHITYRMSEQD